MMRYLDKFFLLAVPSQTEVTKNLSQPLSISFYSELTIMEN